jgi:cold-inducible RNA-binding protein
MNRRLFVGNLSYDATEQDLSDLLEAAGYKPRSISIPLDRATNRTRGFGFVEFESAAVAAEARDNLSNVAQLNGRMLRFSDAQERSR